MNFFLVGSTGNDTEANKRVWQAMFASFAKALGSVTAVPFTEFL